MWFNLTYETSSSSSIVVSVPSAFYRDQVKQRYQSRIENKLFELAGQHLSIEMEVKQRQKSDNVPDRTLPAEEAPIPQIASSQVKTQPFVEKASVRETHQQLRKDYTFETFVIGENNSFAANAAIAIAKNPGTAYNPCLIYGGVGLGKTHLMQAIGNMAWKEKGCKIIYITAENFTNEFVEAIKNNKTKPFKDKYRNADMLLIDDIHITQTKTNK